MSEPQIKVDAVNTRFTITDYNKAIQNLRDGMGQTEPDGRDCSICGDCGHQAWECHHNPLVLMNRPEYKCFHCGEELDVDTAHEHFGLSENGNPLCTKQLQAELEKAREFIRTVVRTECWGYDNLDGCEIQDLAERLGFIVPKIATETDVDGDSDYEVGDTIYVFSDALKEQKGE